MWIGHNPKSFSLDLMRKQTTREHSQSGQATSFTEAVHNGKNRPLVYK